MHYCLCSEQEGIIIGFPSLGAAGEHESCREVYKIEHSVSLSASSSILLESRDAAEQDCNSLIPDVVLNKAIMCQSVPCKGDSAVVLSKRVDP